MTEVVRAWQTFEPESWRDYVLIPWWLLRYAWAWLWTLAWYPAVRHHIPGFPHYYGRHVNPDPIICDCCFWAGMVRWTIHTYGDDGSGEDVEPVDECPRCGLKFDLAKV